MRRLYALLVGIDDYPLLNPLRGCLADIDGYEQFLMYRVDRKTHELHLRTLRDEQATRAAVIEGFQKHLAQAGRDDTALFVFCGHGSQQTSDPKNWTIEPDRQDETIVCYDSRLPGGSDLEDKLLAQFIGEVAAHGAHVLVILDSCHSGSGTRTLEGVRLAPPRFDALTGRSALANGSVRTAASGWALPAAGSRHVLMAACRDHELAQECLDVTQRRGAFSLCLLSALKDAPGSLSYRSLFQSAQARLRARIAGQTPQLEAFDPSDLELPFLGGAAASDPRQFSVDYDPSRGWVANVGAVHGMPDRPDDPVELLLFPRGTTTQSIRSGMELSGTALVSKVLAAESLVSLQFRPDPSKFGFEAMVGRLPAPISMVSLDGDPDGAEEIRRILKTAGPNGGPSPLVLESRTAPFCVLATPERYDVCRLGEKMPITTVERAEPLAGALTVRRLEQILFWQQMRDGLYNPQTGIRDEEFDILLHRDGQILDYRNCRLEYDQEHDACKPPKFSIEARNKGKRILYFAFLAFTESFEISPLLEEGAVRLTSSQTLHVRGGQALSASLPADVLARGGTQTLDILKVIVSTGPFDARLLRQAELGTESSRDIKSCPRILPPHLSRYLNRAQARSLQYETEVGSVDDWTAVDIAITIVRQPPWKRLEPGEISLPAGVRLSCPAGFSGRVRLNSDTAVEPELPTMSMRGLFPDGAEENGPMYFLEKRGNDPGLAVLEFDSLSGSASVNPDHPIHLCTRFVLNADECIVPFAFDGRSAVRVGRSEMNNGTASVLLERMPDPPIDSANGVIRIFLRLCRGA
jgi:Caspase domain